MSWLSKDWKYNDSTVTAKPGYLKRRFAAIRKELREKEEAEAQHRIETAAKVRQIKR